MAKVVKKTRKKGTSWQVDWTDPEGKRCRKSFDLKKDADDYLAKIKVAKKENRYHDVFDVKQETLKSFNELADRYVENYATQKSFKGFKSHVVRELREEFGAQRLSQITYLSIETWRNRRKATTTKAGKTRTDASVNRDMAILGHMLSKAVEWDWLEKSPLKKGKQRLWFKEDNHRVRFLKHAEVEALLKACHDHLRPIVETAIHTGMRRGEILSLKWEQIRNGFIHLEGKHTKSGKARRIPINDRLEEIINYQRQAHQLKSEFVFCDGQGRRFLEVKRSFASACRRAGLEDFRFHDLRHTFASHLVMERVSLKVVQELLGHADLKMTMRYAHLSQGHLKDAVNVLNKLPGGKGVNLVSINSVR